MNVTLIKTIQKLEIKTINEDRKTALNPLITYIQNKVNNQNQIRLNFVCTHNSRRSHFSQIWAQTLAHHFKIPHINCYSSGTEVTAIYPMVLKTLEKQGFSITRLSKENNAIYAIKFSKNAHPIVGFSKTIHNSFNPQSNFAAILTCDHAQNNCPYITGAETRISLTYKDPKITDNTPLEKETYLERSTQIAAELYYIFSSISI